MRPLKIAGIVLAVLVGLALLGVVAVLMLVNPNDYRSDIERAVLERTGRPLHIGGKLDLKIFPWLAISLNDVQLGNPAGYGQGAFVTVKQASVGVKLLPILRKQLQVSRVRVDGLTANLVSRSDSDNNWKDLSESKSTAKSEAGGAATSASIAGVEITNSTLVYTDEAKHTSTRIDHLRMHSGALGSGEKVSLSDFDLDGDLSGSEPGARPIPFSVTSPTVVLNTSDGTLSPTKLQLKFGDVVVLVAASGKDVLSNRVVTGTLQVPSLSPRKVIESFGSPAPVTRDPKALGTLELKTDFVLTQKALRLSAFQLTLDDTHLSGTAAIDDLDSMAVSYDLKVDAINFDRYLSPASRDAVKKPAAKGSAPPAPLPLETLRKLNARGTLQVGSVTLGGLPLTGVILPLTANAGRVHLGPVQARFFGGAYNGDAVLDARSAQAQLSANEHVKGIDMGALAKAALDTTRISGHGDANAVMTGVGNTDADILRSLSGKIDFNVREGALNGVDLWYELRRARALVQAEAAPARTGPERTLFNTLSGSGNLDKGVLRTDDLSIETDYLRVHGKGTLDLGTQAVDYNLVATLYKLPPEGAGSELADLKAADIPFTVRGSLDNLTVRPDLKELAKARVRQEVNKKLEEKSGELQKKLGEKLKDLFGR
jgi:AsmA protein